MSLGCPWEPGVCPRETPYLAAALAWWPPRSSSPGSPRARGPGWALGCRYAWAWARVGCAATRTLNSKLPTDHCRGRPGRSRGRPHPARDAIPETPPAPSPRQLVRRALQCKFQRDKLLINSLEEKRVSFFLLFFICFYFCMAPSYALGSLAAQQFPLHFNILKKMQISTVWPF